MDSSRLAQRRAMQRDGSSRSKVVVYMARGVAGIVKSRYFLALVRYVPAMAAGKTCRSAGWGCWGYGEGDAEVCIEAEVDIARLWLREWDMLEGEGGMSPEKCICGKCVCI